MPDRVNRLSFLLLLKLLFGEPTWFYVVHPDLDPTLGIATGVKGTYISFYVGANGWLWSKISQRKLKKFISCIVLFIIMLVPNAVLSTLCTLALNMICIGIISICTARE